MLGKKPDKPKKSEEEQQLEQRVDEMMNVKSSSNDVSKVAASVNESLTKELNVDAKKIKINVSHHDSAKPLEQTTAPELPGKLKVPADDKAPEKKDKEQADIKAEEPVKEDTEPPAMPEIEAQSSEDPEPIVEANPEDLNKEAYDDSFTNKAVDEIVAQEGDTVLAVEDAKRQHTNAQVKSGGIKQKLKGLLRNKWTWIVLALMLIAVLAVPQTRYKVLGLVIKKSVTITVIDSKTSTPVSAASVTLAGDAGKTDAKGRVQLRAGLGNRDLKVSKRYYKDLNTTHFVGFSSKNTTPLKLEATGRLVPVTVLNKVTGKPVGNAQVQALGTSAKTNSKGVALIALPTKSAKAEGRVSAQGFNDQEATITVTDSKVKENTVEITPSGYVYFLSNRSGTLDVVKSKLDGSDRKVVLEGTGQEDRNTTSLLASRDWRYLVLKARREGAIAALYLVDTSTDKITKFDNSEADFNLVGWHDHNFVYSLTKTKTSFWQAGKIQLKSYDADNLQLNQLDQSQGEGSADSYAYQHLSNFYILKNTVVYSVKWGGSFGYGLNNKQDSIRAVQPGGAGKKDYQTFPSATTSYFDARIYEPEGVYFSVYSYEGNTGKESYYIFENGQVKTANIDASKFQQTYPTFLLSPAGDQTFWADLRDGKNALFLGGPNAENSKQLATLSEFAPYGWLGENYVLVSKNGSELFVASPDSLKAGRKPLKITDYYKPAQTYAGYGYGYGGL